MSLTKQSKLLLKPQPLLVVRHLCSEPTPPSPKDSESSLINDAVDLLLQTPENEWASSTQLQHLLFSSPPTPRLLFQITRRLPSYLQALTFFNFIKSNSLSQEHTHLLSHTFQAIFDLASREPDWENKILDLYKACTDQKVPLSINAATFLIRRFGKANMVDQALDVYDELDPNSKNTHVRNALIDVLIRDGRFDKAFDVLDEMLERESEFPPNDVTGDVVFYALVNKKDEGRNVSNEKIGTLVIKLAEHEVFPNSIWLTQFITRLCRFGKADQAWDVLHELLKSGCPLEAASCNALLSGLGKEGNFKRMNKLLLEMKESDIEPNVVTFGILINRLCKSWKVDEALEVFEKMSGGIERDGLSFEPDVVIYNTLIDGLCKVGRQEEGLRLMERMRSQKGCSPNVFTYNILINGFCKGGNFESGKDLFDQMEEMGIMPNVVTLNILVEGMCRHGRINSAVKFFNLMREKGLRGNVVTYTTLINAFCNANNIQEAMKWFHRMHEVGCSADAIVYYNLISGLCQAGRLNDANDVLSKLKEAGFRPDIVCYNNLIGGFCKKNMVDQAYEMLQEMEDNGMKPDCVTYNTLISYFSKAGNYFAARRVMKRMLKDGLAPTVVTYGALIHAYCLNGLLNEAMKIFKDMSSVSKVAPNTVIYNILIDSLCKNNEVELALSLMDDMKVKAVRPNTATYNAIFKGLREKNLLEKAFKLMDKMIENACQPDYISMEILTEWLPAVGETEKLRKFVQGYKVSATPA